MNTEITDRKIHDLETSILETKEVLLESLQGCCCNGMDIHSFVSHRALARPPFSFIQNLVKLYITSLSFAQGLYTEEELDPKVNIHRQDKIRFLVKILACVAFITKERVDIYVSPVHVLSGIDITITHFFLRLLARAALVSSDITKLEAQRVLDYGESVLYRKAVQVRNTIVKIQSHIRQRQVKRRFEKASPVQSEAPVNPAIGTNEEKDTERQSCPCHETLQQNILATNSICGIDEERNIERQSSACNEADKALRQSIPDTNPRNEKVSKNDESKELSICSQSESCTICETKAPSARAIESPIKMPKMKRFKAAVSASPKSSGIATPSKMSNEVIRPGTKKISVLYGVIQEKVLGLNQKPTTEIKNSEMQIEQPSCIGSRPLHEEIERQEQIQRQWMQLHKRQDLICRMSEELKTKENDMILREKRLLHLSDSIKRRQMKLERDRCSQIVEFDEIKTTLFENSLKQRNDPDGCTNPNRPGSSKKQIKEMIAVNPTLTDLRLMLEKKSECISRRERRLIQIERDLRHENHVIMTQMKSQCNHITKATKLI